MQTSPLHERDDDTDCRIPFIFKYALLNILLIEAQRIEKSESFSGSFHMQWKCSFNRQNAMFSNGQRVCVFSMASLKQWRASSLWNNSVRLYVTSVKK